MKLNNDKAVSWKVVFSDKKLTAYAIAVAIFVSMASYGFTCFLEWNETREGAIINDHFLNSFKAVNTSIPVFMLTYLSVILGVSEALKKPYYFLTLVFAIFFLTVFRTGSLLTFPLEAPKGMIPLRDFLLEGTFYSGKVLRKDLFFSGHTANVLMFAFLSNKKWKKYMLIGFGVIVGVLLLIQKAHFTVDVVVAPFFAYGAVKLAKFLSQKVFSKISINKETA